jgi:hypothetical protein
MRTVAMLCAAALAAAAAEQAPGTTAMPATSHLVSTLDTKDFGAETLRIGDLNGDGAPDLLFVQSVFGTREITCLTATTIAGGVLWQYGKPAAENGRIYADLPAQVYDWDADGRNEVLFVRQATYVEPYLAGGYARERAARYEGKATMVVLDATTGQEKRQFAIPAPADDCFIFADLTGRGRRQDLVVKDRYWNVWGVSAEGQELWTYAGSVGHFPAYGDVDGDGRDEVFVGFALLDHDGKVLFQHDPKGAHQDAAYVVQLPDGSWRLLFGNGGIHCLRPDGHELWHHPLAEAQHIVAGRFRPDLGPVQFMVIDRGQPQAGGGRAPAMLYLYDLDGAEVWKREQPTGSCFAAAVALDWSGQGEPREVLVYNRGGTGESRPPAPVQPAAIYDGWGNIVDTVSPAYPADRAEKDRTAQHYAIRADVWGDRRDEVLFSGPRGASVWANARPLAIPTLYNQTLYPGM